MRSEFPGRSRDFQLKASIREKSIRRGYQINGLQFAN